MRLQRLSSSIRTKFLLVGLAAVFTVGLSGLVETAGVQRLLRDQARAHVVDIAKQAAFIAGPLIAFDSQSELRKALELFHADPYFA
jgi:hypothetical protein